MALLFQLADLFAGSHILTIISFLAALPAYDAIKRKKLVPINRKKVFLCFLFDCILIDYQEY